jgi:hypothetical protein
MKSDIDEFLDEVDQWKFKLHDRLKRMNASQRKAFWNQIHEQARARGLPVVDPEKPSKAPKKRVRRIG